MTQRSHLLAKLRQLRISKLLQEDLSKSQGKSIISKKIKKTRQGNFAGFSGHSGNQDKKHSSLCSYAVQLQSIMKEAECKRI